MDPRRLPGTVEYWQYRERVKQQTLSWAEGRIYHNFIDDECCPDFSCCHRGLFIKNAAERWKIYRQEHGYHQ